jgi:spermidine synthase/thioredoxin-like negative regulator of GroEL
MGMWKTVLLASGVSAGLGLIVWMAVREVTLGRKVAVGAAFGVVILVFGVFLPSENVLLLNQGWYYEKPADLEAAVANTRGRQILFHREGVNASVSVTRQQGYVVLRMQGKPDASNNPFDLPAQFLVGHLPALFAPEGARAALIGYGSGTSASSLMAHSHIKSLDILEIEQAAFEASPYFEFLNRGILKDPRVRVIVEDGRTHLTYTPKQYDVIVSYPSNPSIAGASNLFTADFYRLVRERLTPSGVFLGWMQLYDVSEESFWAVAASLMDVFPHVAVFQVGGHVLFLASPQPVQLPWETYLARSSAPAIQEALQRLDFQDPAEVLAHFVTMESHLEGLVKDFPRRSTDDNVWLEHQMARESLLHARRTHIPIVFRLYPPELQFRRLIPGAPLERIMPKILRHVARRDALRQMWLIWSKVWEKLLAQWKAEAAEPDAGASEEAFRNRIHEAVIHLERTPRLGAETLSAAEPHIKEAFALTPEIPRVRLAYGSFLFLSQDFDAAKEILESIPPQAVNDYYYHARVLMAGIAVQEENVEEALHYLEEAFSMNPCYPDAIYGMASMLLAHPEVEVPERLKRLAELYHPEREDLHRMIALLPAAPGAQRGEPAR